jgi:hypothetical protein
MKTQISNRKSKITLVIAACLTLAAFGPLTAGPLQYAFETIDAPGLDVTNPFVYTFINNRGMIGQDYVDTAGNPHYAVRIANTWQVLEVPGAVVTIGVNPNNAGRVALDWFDSNNGFHLAIWQEGRPLQYVADVPGGYHWSGANGFNDRGIATAWTFLPWTDPELAYGLLQDTHTGRYQFLTYPGADVLWTQAIMTNNGGTTVGSYTTLTYEFHAFTRDGDTFTNIDVPGGTNQYATFINNESYIVGFYADANGASVGFIRDPMGRVTDFTVPDALQTVPDCITDNLKISGDYQAQDGSWHGFVATPAGRR